MRQRISSSLTFLYKRIFPALWIGLFGLGTIGVWLGSFRNSQAPPQEMKWTFLAGWIGGSAFILWFARRLKVVWLEGDHLIVSDYSREEVIPLHSIERVSETRMWSPKMIRIHLRWGSDWGDEISFMAPLAFQVPFGVHPIVRKLRERSVESGSGTDI